MGGRREAQRGHDLNSLMTDVSLVSLLFQRHTWLCLRGFHHKFVSTSRSLHSRVALRHFEERADAIQTVHEILGREGWSDPKHDKGLHPV
jgi:hypothetical protein